MVGEPPNLGRQRREERLAHHGLGGDQLAEPIAGEDVGLGRLDRHRRRRAWGAVEQGELAEEVTGSKRREDRFVAGVGGERDLDRAGHHDEQRVTRVADMEHGLAAAEPADPHPLREVGEAAPIESGEQGDTRQGIAHRPDVHH